MKIVQKNFKFIEPFEPLDEVTHLIVHHTSRRNMTAEVCHKFHQEKFGWSGIGYNFFIEKDGTIVEGRGFHVGAHAYGYNRNSIGVCLTGDFDVELPTDHQWDAFFPFCKYLMGKYRIEPESVLGHRELEGVTKSCPGRLFDLEKMRKNLYGITTLK